MDLRNNNVDLRSAIIERRRSVAGSDRASATGGTANGQAARPTAGQFSDRLGPVEPPRLHILQTAAGRSAVLAVFSTAELFGEVSRRGEVLQTAHMTDAQVWSECARRRQARRKNRRGGRRKKLIDSLSELGTRPNDLLGG